MNEAVEDGVGECRVADDVVPLLDRGLAGDDGRADAVPVLEDFEQIVPVLGAERGEPPVVEHEDLGLGERFEQVRITTVGAGDGERAEQPGQARGRARCGRDGRRCGRARKRFSSSAFPAFRPGRRLLRICTLGLNAHEGSAGTVRTTGVETTASCAGRQDPVPGQAHRRLPVVKSSASMNS